MRKYFLLFSACFFTTIVNAQLVINGGTITIGDNASISVQGDLTSNADILGTGKIVMSGTSAQQINMNGFSIPNLEINSTGGVALSGNSRISNTLTFTTGKIQSSNYSLTLAAAVTVTGAGTGKFVETSGTGQLRREVNTAGSYELPVGAVNHYMPLQYQVSGGSIAAGAYVGTQLIAGAHPAKPIRSTDYISAYWKPAYSGITGATVNVTGTYVETAGVTGDETLLNGIRHDGTDWSLANSLVNTTSNAVTYNNIANGTDL
jgi:hypothetical protein